MRKLEFYLKVSNSKKEGESYYKGRVEGKAWKRKGKG